MQKKERKRETEREREGEGGRDQDKELKEKLEWCKRVKSKTTGVQPY